jgi:hypothetical protein
MSFTLISREAAEAQTTIAVGITVATSDEIPFAFAQGKYFIPAGSSITLVTFYAAPIEGGTYTIMRDILNANITQVVSAGFNYEFPDEAFGAPWVKMIGDAADSVLVSFKG